MTDATTIHESFLETALPPLVPYVREAQKRGARLIVIDPRETPLARQADLLCHPVQRWHTAGELIEVVALGHPFP